MKPMKVIEHSVVSVRGSFQFSYMYLLFFFLATEDVPVHMSANRNSTKVQSGSREPETSNGRTVSSASTGLTRALAIQP